jgi:acyl-CoA hydrolase
MDEIAAITAMRFSRQQFVTVSLDRIDFTKAIAQGMMVELVGKVIRMGRTSIQVKVEVYIESLTADFRELAVSGVFTMVAVDEARKPIPVKIPA